MNAEEWVTVTSSEESCDSDKIDSDIEAELYSSIHHEQATERTSTDFSNVLSPQVSVTSSPKVTPNKSPFIKHGHIIPNAYTSFETLEVKAIKDCNNENLKEKSDVSFSNLSQTFKTPEVIVTKSYSVDVQRKSDVPEDELYTSFETPEVKVNSNMNGKRKSDVSINNLENNQLKSKNDVGSIKSEGNVEGISRKKQKITNREKSKKESAKASVLNKIVVYDSSDSDSIVWSEGGKCDIELQTNVEPEVVALSSDSDSFSDASYEPFEEICSVKRNSESSLQPSTASSSKDLWHINSDDLYRSKGRSKSSRYHERAVLKCTNCHLKGHTVKFCSVPKNVKCYVCGGSHTGMGCRDKLCSRCYQRGHDVRFCNQRFVDLCLLCNMRGHSVKYCPDLWRRYHLTTTRGKIVIENPVPQDSPIYCFNCGEQGHYGAECRLLRPDRCNNFQTWTSVIAHVHPSETIKRFMEDQRHPASRVVPPFFPTYQHRLPPACPSLTSPFPKKNKKKKKNSNTNDNIKNAKKKKNRSSGASQTPENMAKTSSPKEFKFPRTPKSIRKKFKGKRKIEKEPFMSGLHRRLGLNPK